MNTGEAVNQLRIALKKDKGYFQSWKSNIAMAFYDGIMEFKAENKRTILSKEELLQVANKAAERFLLQLIK